MGVLVDGLDLLAKAFGVNLQVSHEVLSRRVRFYNEVVFIGRLQLYMNQEFSDVQAGLRKGRGTRNQIANICWIIEKSKKVKQTNKQKSTPTSALLTMQKPLCGSRQNVENSERDENTRPPYLLPEKLVRRSRSNGWR